MTAVTTIATWMSPYSISFDPSGRFAYVANHNSNNVSVYTINQNTGTLTASTSVAAGTGPRSVVISRGIIANNLTVTPSAVAGGSISPSTPQTISLNASTTFTVTSNTGYTASVGGTCGGTLVGNTYTTNAITGNCTVDATFTLASSSVTTTAGTGGTISGAQIVNNGSTAVFTVTPDTGYSITSVTGCNGTLSGNTYTTGAVTGPCTISASFAINTFTLTASAGANGNVTPTGATTVNYGTSQTYSITPATGYHVADVLVDGVSVGAVATYTFTNVTAAHTISASFAINVYPLIASTDANGSITPAGTTALPYGSTQTYTMTPNTGYHVADVHVDGVSVGAVTTYTISNVVSSHTIAVSYAINAYTVTPVAVYGGIITPATPQTVNYNGTATVTVMPI